MNGGGLNFSSQSTVTGTGVTFYFTSNTGPSDNIQINAGADVDLTAPVDDLDGGIPGVLFFQDRLAPTMTHTFNGGADMSMDGIFYFPNQNVIYNGGSTVNTQSTIFVVSTITFNGDTEIGSFGGSATDNTKQLVQSLLVE